MQTVQELQRLLAEAEAARRVVRVRGRTSKVPLAEYIAASEKVLEAERTLAAASGEQYAVPLELGFEPACGVSAPLLLANEDLTILTFSAVKLSAANSNRLEGTAVIEFDLCESTLFGYPNDEALAGHPLYGRGLSAYSIFKINNSSWKRLQTEQNRVSFPNTQDSNSLHLLFSFHDSTFECICRGIKTTAFSAEPYGKIFSEVSRKVLERHPADEFPATSCGPLPLNTRIRTARKWGACP